MPFDTADEALDASASAVECGYAHIGRVDAIVWSANGRRVETRKSVATITRRDPTFAERVHRHRHPNVAAIVAKYTRSL